VGVSRDCRNIWNTPIISGTVSSRLFDSTDARANQKPSLHKPRPPRPHLHKPHPHSRHINHDLSSIINPRPHYTTAVIATCLTSIIPRGQEMTHAVSAILHQLHTCQVLLPDSSHDADVLCYHQQIFCAD